MTPSPDDISVSRDQSTSHSPPTTQKKHKKGDGTKVKSKNIKNELGRKDKHGEGVTTIYPKAVADSPPENYGTPTSQEEMLGNITTSPLLAALGSNTAISAQYTSEWAKTLPFATKQQPTGNGVSIGESPPMVAPPHLAREGVNGFSPASVSPPAVGARPLSHPTQVSSFGGRLQPSPRSVPRTDRRFSMYSNSGYRSPLMNSPPLPHQPQAHFYGLNNIDLALQRQNLNGIRPGTEEYYCGFDTLRVPSTDSTRSFKNVLLVGYEGGLDVLRIERTKMDVIGRLEGLRGSVVGAKLLLPTGSDDEYEPLRPLIALVIHGPRLTTNSDDATASMAFLDEAENDSSGPLKASDVKEYETTVEVYSLLKREHVATLLRCPPVSVLSPIDSPLFRPPPPTSDLKLDANGRFLTVSSGVSGEIFLFTSVRRRATAENTGPEGFRCIAKLWTSVHTRTSSSNSSSSSSNGGHSFEGGEEPRQHGTPLMSANGRWLAIVPPASATHLSINGSALLSGHASPPGLDHHTAPPQPNDNCAVDAPQSDGLAGRFAREGTQAAVRGAKWAADWGKQALSSYFGKPGSQQDLTGTGVDPVSQHHFPPTHGQQSFSPTRHDSNLVSIYDLNRFLDYQETKRKGLPEPVATFAPPHGISHLSFSPSGIMLMTVGKKGDVQEVWNLMRIGSNRKSRRSHKNSPEGPLVRQVARFTRMTVANVVDVIWTGPNGRGVAILTENGTTHLYPMPSTAFQWPPARATVRVAASKSTAEPSMAQQDRGRASGAVSSAMNVINGAGRTFSSFRNRSGSETAKSPNYGLSMTSAVGARTSKAVAMNISRSVGSAAMSFAHAGDNKIHIPIADGVPVPKTVTWLSSKNGRPSLATVSAGKVDIYRVSMQPARSKKHPARVKKKRMVQFQVPDVRGGPLPPSLVARLGNEGRGTTSLEGTWTLRNPRRDSRRKVNPSHVHPLSFAELETSAPFLPFHTDRRVHMFFTTNDALNPSLQTQYTDDLLGGVAVDTPPPRPAFGGPLLGQRVFNTHPSHMLSGGGGDDDSDTDPFDGHADVAAENRLVKKGGDYEEVQIIVTTRRKRRGDAGDAAEGEEGFFEDDCEVLDFAEDRV